MQPQIEMDPVQLAKNYGSAIRLPIRKHSFSCTYRTYAVPFLLSVAMAGVKSSHSIALLSRSDGQLDYDESETDLCTILQYK